MGILQFPAPLAGQVGVIGAIKYMTTTDNLATITTAGYLNNPDLAVYPIAASDILGVTYSFNTNTQSGSFELFSVSISGGVITLVAQPTTGIVLPTIANHIATYTNTSGNLSEDPATAISGGNIQAGLSGTAGTLASFPSTALKGSLKIVGVANTGNTNVTISNAAHGQASVYSIPDSGQATANFITSDNATSQTINTGNLILTAGSFTTTNGGVIQSGSSGHAGSLKVFPTTASRGDLKITISDQTGNTEVVVNAAQMGQATTLTIPDPGTTAASFDLSLSSATANTNKVFMKTITATAAALATAGHVSVMAHPSATSQFKILNIRVMYAAAGLSGGGGDRLLSLTDGTIVFNQAGVTAALLGTPVYTLWGGTGNPLPGAVSTVSTAGADIYLVYAGGTTDYTTGQILIEVELAQVTA